MGNHPRRGTSQPRRRFNAQPVSGLGARAVGLPRTSHLVGRACRSAGESNTTRFQPPASHLDLPAIGRPTRNTRGRCERPTTPQSLATASSHAYLESIGNCSCHRRHRPSRSAHCPLASAGRSQPSCPAQPYRGRTPAGSRAGKRAQLRGNNHNVDIGRCDRSRRFSRRCRRNTH